MKAGHGGIMRCPHPEFESTRPIEADESGTMGYLCKACGAEVPGPAFRAWKELGLRMFHGCQN